MKKHSLLLMITMIITLLAVSFSCDTAYNASITGTVVDKELYDQDPKTGAINNVIVYVYLDEKDREADYEYWVKNNVKPDEKPSKDEKGKKTKKLYVDKSITNADGVFTFNGIWWLDFFPEFGTDASVQNAYFMFYHQDYGMVKYEKVTQLTGDGRTRNLTPFPIVKQIHEVVLKGRVIDKNRTLNGSPVGLPGVQVNVYTTDSWTVENSTVKVKPEDWKTKPTYSFLTDSDGYYNQIISFRKFPAGSASEVYKTQVLVTFSADNFSLFELTPEAHNQFTATNWTAKESYAPIDLKDINNWVLFDQTHFAKDFDVDVDGYQDAYYRADIEVKQQDKPTSQSDRRKNVITLADVSMRQTLLTATIQGRVYDGVKQSDKDNGLNDAMITVKDFPDSTQELGSTTTQTKVIAQGTNPVTEKGSYSLNISCRVFNYEGDVLERPLFVQAAKGNKAVNNASINGGKIKFSTTPKANAIDFELQ